MMNIAGDITLYTPLVLYLCRIIQIGFIQQFASNN